MAKNTIKLRFPKGFIKDCIKEGILITVLSEEWNKGRLDNKIDYWEKVMDILEQEIIKANA